MSNCTCVSCPTCKGSGRVRCEIMAALICALYNNAAYFAEVMEENEALADQNNHLKHAHREISFLNVAGHALADWQNLEA